MSIVFILLIQSFDLFDQLSIPFFQKFIFLFQFYEFGFVIFLFEGFFQLLDCDLQFLSFVLFSLKIEG